MSFNFPYDFSAQTAITGAELQAQFDVIRAQINGNLTETDISSTANIAPSQLQYEDQVRSFQLKLSSETGGAAFPAPGTIIALCPIETLSGDETWTITDMQWVCSDTGDNTGQVKVQYGYFDTGAGLWSSLGDVSSTTTIASAVGNTGAQGSLSFASGTSYTMSVSGTIRSLALVVVTSGAAQLSAAYDSLVVNITAKRGLI